MFDRIHKVVYQTLKLNSFENQFFIHAAMLKKTLKRIKNKS